MDFKHTKWDQSKWTEEQKIQWQNRCFGLGYYWQRKESTTPVNLHMDCFVIESSSRLAVITESFEDYDHIECLWDDMFSVDLNSPEARAELYGHSNPNFPEKRSEPIDLSGIEIKMKRLGEQLNATSEIPQFVLDELKEVCQTVREQSLKLIARSATEPKDNLIGYSVIGDTRHAPTKGNSKYDRTIIGKDGSGKCIADVYRVLSAFEVTNPQLQHLVKKALCAGLRGHKDTRQDLVDILHSAQSALDMFDDKENKNV
jgi:hypothetical protein